MQLGPPNPLEECISQFLDTKVASQRCHMELFNEEAHGIHHFWGPQFGPLHQNCSM